MGGPTRYRDLLFDHGGVPRAVLVDALLGEDGDLCQGVEAGAFGRLNGDLFDAPLLCVVLAGDARLIDKLRREELIPLGSRIRTRLATEHASREELLAGLNHLLAGAGNASLMTPALRHTLCDPAAGNYRILTTMAAELLAAAPQRELPQLDKKLYLEVFVQPEAAAPRRTTARR